MLFCITLGDWLGKGHDIRRDFLYDCNRPAAEIAAAYGMSREKYGVRFDGFKKDDPFAVWAGYGESGMSPEARGALERAGLLDGDDEPWRMRDRADLVMRFIALSMPAGFTYEPVVVPSLNGLLRADIGYGLFEGGIMLRRRLDPPQGAAVAVSVAAPLAAGVIYIALRTDWLRQVGRWLAWTGGALAAGLAQIAAWPWVDIGYAFLVFAAMIVVTAFLGWTAFLVPNAIGILWRWRLTPTETLRAMAVVACGVGANVAAVVWWIHHSIWIWDERTFHAWDYLWLCLFVIEPFFWLRLVVRSHMPAKPLCRAARFIAPEQTTAFLRLSCSLVRFERNHYVGEKTPFGGDDEYAIDLTAVESRRNEWIRDNLDDLDAYAEYHPSFAKALGEWRTTQEKED